MAPKLGTIAFIAMLFFSCKKDGTPSNDPPPATQADIGPIDSAIAKWQSDNTMPGMSLAVSRNGKMVYTKGYGMADKESGEKVTTASLFRIASVSKLLTSVAVMKLVQGGKLTLEQKVFGSGAILGTTYGTQPYKKYVADITVNDLLHHTIGGWGQDNDPAFFNKNLDVAGLINWTLDNVALSKQPGTGFAYSNFGYMLLGRIVEKLGGKTYEQYVTDEIWSKVGATASAIAGTALADRKEKEVKYYGQQGDASFVYDYMQFRRADGAFGWLGTPKDLLLFANAVDSSSTRPDILSPETIKKMVAVTPASIGFGGSMQFGCGWVVEGGEWFWWGSLPGTFAILYRNSNGICVAATANSRRQPTPENGLYSFIRIINFMAFDKTIPWQDIDQF